MPVGRWVIRTAESVVFTDWPPGPDERKTSIRRSLGSMSTSTVSSASGATKTPAAEVWMRPCDSVTGHPLHAVHAALELQPRPHPVGRGRRAGRLDGDRDVLVAAEVGLGRGEHLGLPAPALGVPQVHPQQVAGEQRRLLAALARLDLDDHVLGVVGIARGEQLGQPVLQLGDPVGETLGLVGEAGVHRRQFARRLQVAAGRVEIGGAVTIGVSSA